MYKPLIYKDLDLSDKYLVSDSGKIFSKKSNKILKPYISKTGYYQVCISLGSRQKKKVIKIHIAVAYNFVDGYKERLMVNHKDGNKLNNDYHNLEWVTCKENTNHALNNDLLKCCHKIKCNQTGEVFNSISQATRWCGLNHNGLREYLKGNRKTAGKHPITGERLTWALV